METKIITAYLIYLPIMIGLTIFVAKSLFKNGKAFMIEIFKGKEEIANATNTLFQLGFYLLNIGWGLLILKISYYSAFTNQDIIEVLSKKIGAFAIYLGAMLFLNLFLFFRGKKKSKEQKNDPIYTVEM